MTRRRARNTGFTLLELLIALAIFALISVIAFTGLRSTIDSRERINAQADRLIEIQRAFDFFRRDLEQAVPRPVRDQLGDFNPNSAFRQVPEGIVFTRGGRRNPLGLERSGLERLGYGLQDGTLVRSRWLALDQPPDPAIEELPLLADVESLNFRFLGPDKHWVEQWPPLNSVSPEPGLPQAVEVTLELPGYGSINRIFLLPY
jgi:general secretion pathway protein J